MDFHGETQKTALLRRDPGRRTRRGGNGRNRGSLKVLESREMQKTLGLQTATESSGSLQRALKLYRAQKALNAWDGLDVRRGVGGRGRP